jgi:hypothetical protein
MATKKTLSTKAMLVGVSIHKWGNRVVERELADKTADENKAEHGMFYTTKRLVPRREIKDVLTAFGRFKTFHYENTAPWLDNGYRILPSANYMTYMTEARKLREEALESVNSLVKAWARIKASAVAKLGDAYDENDYPTAAQIKRLYGIDIDVCPLPDRADFRADIPDAEIAVVSQNIDEQVQRALAKVQADLVERIYKVVETLRDRLKDFKASTNKNSKKRVIERNFRDSVIVNIRELCEFLPKMNIGDDARINDLLAKLNKDFAKQDPAVLRDDTTLRNAAVKKADDLLKSMSAYIGEQ